MLPTLGRCRPPGSLPLNVFACFKSSAFILNACNPDVLFNFLYVLKTCLLYPIELLPFINDKPAFLHDRGVPLPSTLPALLSDQQTLHRMYVYQVCNLEDVREVGANYYCRRLVILPTSFCSPIIDEQAGVPDRCRGLVPFNPTRFLVRVLCPGLACFPMKSISLYPSYQISQSGFRMSSTHVNALHAACLLPVRGITTLDHHTESEASLFIPWFGSHTSYRRISGQIISIDPLPVQLVFGNGAFHAAALYVGRQKNIVFSSGVFFFIPS